MRRITKGLALMLSIIFATCCFSTFADNSFASVNNLTEIEHVDGYKLMAEDQQHKLFLNTNTTNFYIEHVKTENKVYALTENIENDTALSPLSKVEVQSVLALTFWDPIKKTENTKYSNGVCVKSGKYSVYSQENGFIIKYNFESQDVSISLSVTLKDGRLLCSVPKNSIEEKSPESQMLLRIAILPYMINGQVDTDGEIILPDGCGEILNFDSSYSFAAAYQKPIYGRNLSTTLSLESKTGYDITCPYIAVLKDEIGVLAIPEKAAAIGYVNANPSGKTNLFANAYFSFDYRARDIAIIGDKQTVASQSTSVFDNDVYSDEIIVGYQFDFESPSRESLARIYGKYLLPERTTAPQDGHSAIFDIFGFVNEKKSFLGFPYTAKSILSTGEDIISLANDSDLKDATFNLKNITNHSANGTVQTSVKPIEKVIDSSKLKELVNSENRIYMNINPISFHKGNLFVNKFYGISKTVYGGPVNVYKYRESTHMENRNIPNRMLVSPNKISSAINKIVKSAKKIGIQGVSSDELGCVNYYDYSVEGTLVDCHIAQEKAIATTANNVDVILSNPYDYAIKYCSAIVDIPIESSNNDLCCGSYPFLQIALGNKISYAVEPINLNRSPEIMFLKAISTGSALHYSFILTNIESIIGTELNYLYCADFEELRESVKTQYTKWKEVNRLICGSSLIEYKADGNTIQSIFENDICITVDLNNRTYAVSN